MLGPFRRWVGGSFGKGRLLTVLHAVSIAVGLVSAWMVLGPESLYSMASISIVGLLVVHVLRVPGGSDVSYQTGVLAGVLAMSWLGLALAFDLLGVLWACALAMTTAPVRQLGRRLRRQLGQTSGAGGDDERREPARSGTTTYPATDAPPEAAGMRRAVLLLPELDVDGLCLAWRRSYFQLLDARRTPISAAVVHYRQCILDEIGLRDPYGMSCWLASGPRASGNPLPFLQGRAAPPADPGGPGSSLPERRARREQDDGA